MFFVEILDNDSFKTLANVLGEFAELSVMFAFSSFEGTEGRDCVFNA